jgi:hypothetical protein
MADQIYKVRDPSGTIREIKGPAGATDEEVIAQAKILFPARPVAEAAPPVAEAAPKEVPFGQKVISFIRPTVEGTLAATGAVGGAPLGPFGSITGAGLGYGIGKTYVDLIEQALGYQAPPTAGEALLRGAQDVVTGATYEVGGRVLGQGLGWLGGKLADIRQIPKQKAAALAKKVLATPEGSDLPQVLNALRNAPPGASVAEATAGIQNPTWQALVRDSLQGTPEGTKYLNRLIAQSDDEAINALARLAGGRTATDVRAVAEAGRTAARGVTTPMRAAALNRANLGKEVAQLESMSAKLGEQAAAEVQKVRRMIELGDLATAAVRLRQIKANLPVGSTKLSVTPSGITEQWGKTAAPPRTQPGAAEEWGKTLYVGKLGKMADEWASKAATASLDLGQGATFAQGAADALRSVGIKPLESAPLIQQLSAAAKNPSLAGNDLALGALSQVSDDIAKWTGSGGVIDARALDAIRKNAVNAVVAKLRPGFDATAQRNAAAGVLTDIKPLITNAIEDAGGVGYREYLAKHTELMQKLAEKQLTGEALRLWKTNKDAFVQLVQNESPEAVEKILGPGRYNIAVELAGNTMDVLSRQAQKHVAQLAASKQASEGTKALANVLEQEMPKFRLPSFLTFWAAAGNKTLSGLEDAIGKRTMHMLSASMRDPAKAANLLETLPGNERVWLLKILSDPDTYSRLGRNAGGMRTMGTVGAASAITNALAPESENALAP